jgi:hypothetical protein
VDRIAWEDLADDLKDAIERRTGLILSAQTMTAGKNSPVAATVATAEGKTFVKGLPASDRRSASQLREAAVAPLVTGISPALYWQFEEAGWIVLGYEYVEGRHADYRPGSGDPDALLPVFTALGEINVPDPSPFKSAEDRLRRYIPDPETLALFKGSTLQHTDWVPYNVLVSPERPYLIDWAWPTLGAAWMDPAYWLLRLMASGHSVQEAERYALHVPAYADADPEHLDVFASANVQMWDEIERECEERITDWMHSVVLAAREWDNHRRNRAKVFAL